MTGFNIYNDHPTCVTNGFGVDIASQRSDRLDQDACEYIQELFDTGMTPLAVDAGCGLGGLACRMASAGASVFAIDKATIDPALRKQHRNVVYVTQSVEDFPLVNLKLFNENLDVVVAQRMIHYLRPKPARQFIRNMATMLKPGGLAFVSASGMNSELGNDYPDIDKPWIERFSVLSEPMAVKHGIYPPVCLYFPNDLITLLTDSGFEILYSETSPFGNVKVSAKKMPTKKVSND